jgi:hypothetical protein
MGGSGVEGGRWAADKDDGSPNSKAESRLLEMTSPSKQMGTETCMESIMSVMGTV